jgi:hypothetical protein
MKQTVGIFLIIGALLLAYIGIVKINDSTAEVKFLGISISAEDEKTKETGYIFLGLAALCMVGGILVSRR